MSRKLEWNPDHKNADEQQDEFVDTYLKWSPKKKWEYLMALVSQGASKETGRKSKRRIEWK